MKRIRTILDELREAKEDLQSDLYKLPEWRYQMERHVAGLEHRCFVIFNSDWQRRVRWMFLGALAGGLFVALATHRNYGGGGMMLAPMDWILIALGDSLLLWAFLLSRRSGIRTMAVLFGYMLAENIMLAILLMAGASPTVYARAYYWPALAEGLLMAGVALEIGAALVPARRAVILRYGSAVLAVPIFCVLAMGDRLLLALVCTRLSELSAFGSICLLCMCIAFSEEDAVGSRLARCYVFMLVMVGGSQELLSISGMAGSSALLAPTMFAQIIRRIVPVSWVIGMAVLVWALRSSSDKKAVSPVAS